MRVSKIQGRINPKGSGLIYIYIYIYHYVWAPYSKVQRVRVRIHGRNAFRFGKLDKRALVLEKLFTGTR